MESKKFAEILYNTILPSNISYEESALRVAPLSKYISTVTPNELFRYRSCNERNLDAFYKDQCWVSTAAKMNDGFDARIFYDKEALISLLNELKCQKPYLKDFIMSGQGFPNNLPELSSIKKLYSMISSSSEAEINTRLDNYINYITNDLRTIDTLLVSGVQETVKFCCLSESIASPAMWGLYADDESGFALSYNFSNSGNPVEAENGYSRTCSCFPVIYSNERYKVSPDFIRSLILQRWTRQAINHIGIEQFGQQEVQFLLSLFPCPDTFVSTKVALHKSVEWSREGEWRVFCSSANDDAFSRASHGYFTKKPSALYLGRRISSIYEHILRNIAKEKGIPVYKMQLMDDSPSYELIPKAIQISNT